MVLLRRALASDAARDRTLRRRLAHNPVVLRTVLGRTRPLGRARCGLYVLGSGSGGRLYAWLLCGEVDEDRATASVGADAVLLTTTGRGSDTRLTEVRFPRQASLRADIEAMFPPRIARLAVGGNLPTTPSYAELFGRTSGS